MTKPFFDDAKVVAILSKHYPKATNVLVSVVAHYVYFTKVINGKMYFDTSNLFDKKYPEYELLKNPTAVKRNIVIGFLLTDALLSPEIVGEIFDISPKVAITAGKVVKDFTKMTDEVREFYAALIATTIPVNVSKLATGNNEEKIEQIINEDLSRLIERKCKAMSEIDEINEQLINAYKNNKVAIKNMFNNYYSKAVEIYHERLEAFSDLSIRELETQKYPEAFKVIYDKTNKLWHHHSLFLRDAKDIFNTDILTEDLRMAINDLGTKWIKLDMMICNWSAVYEQNITPQVCSTSGTYIEKVRSIDLNRRALCQCQNIFGK